MRFVFTEPTFVKKDREFLREFYIEHTNEKRVFGNEFEIKLRNEMKQAAIAKRVCEMVARKSRDKILKQANSAQPRLVYIENKDDHLSINGTVDFTSDG